MTFLADLVLLIHLAFVLFVITGFAAIPVGGWRGWRWVRSVRFRAAHLGAIAFVAGEAVVGFACPLSVWEDALRGRTAQASFMARFVHRVLFYDLPEWVFTAAYGVLALAALSLWWLVPVRRRRGEKGEM